MGRINLIAWMLSVCFIALIPTAGTAKTGDVKTSMTALQAETAKLGAPKLQGSDLYFGNTKVSADLVDAVVKKNGGVATLFAKSGDQYVRVATTVRRKTVQARSVLPSTQIATPLQSSRTAKRTTETRLFSARPMTLDMSRSRTLRVP